MADPRVTAYARLIVEHSLDVQPGWQVLVRTTPLARPLHDEVVRQIAARGAYAISRLSWTEWPVDLNWALHAPEELVGQLPPADLALIEQMDARVSILAPENMRQEADLSPERMALIRKARRPFFQRSMNDEIPWVGCQWPTPALAQEAGMTTDAFGELLFTAVLQDWLALGKRMRVWCDAFDAAREVRITGAGTDLRLSLEGRQGAVSTGYHNLPDGEFFFSPVEDSAEGVIEFGEFPAESDGHLIEGIRLEFRAGEVVGATATRGEHALHAALATDPGAKRLGELGIGCNEGITQYLRNTLFDEKIAGTIHLALGQSYTRVGGTNQSAIHWDIVKDLRGGGTIELDGVVVQRDGRWLI
jgi:aminopeptidase